MATSTPEAFRVVQLSVTDVVPGHGAGLGDAPKSTMTAFGGRGVVVVVGCTGTVGSAPRGSAGHPVPSPSVISVLSGPGDTSHQPAATVAERHSRAANTRTKRDEGARRARAQRAPRAGAPGWRRSGVGLPRSARGAVLRR